MSQGFQFRFNNETNQAISLSDPSNQDDCIDEISGIDSPLGAGDESTYYYAEVRTLCDNGLREFDFNPTQATVAGSKGSVTLNFDKSTSAQNPYGTVSIQSYTPALVSESNDQKVEIIPTLTRSNNSDKEWAQGTINFELSVVPK